MTRLEVTGIKGLGALIVSFFIYMVDVVNEAVIVLVFFMIIDMITGLLRSWITKSFNSTTGFSGTIKKFFIILMVGMAASLEYLLISVGQDPKGVLLLGVTSFFIVNEGISILENCAQIRLPIPAVLFNALEKLHKDPTGKEQRLARHPMMDRVDKADLLKQNEILQHEIQQLKKKEEESTDEH